MAGPESTESPSPRHVKVLKLQVLKPADGGDWKTLGSLLREVRYRVFRLANLAVSESYLSFHLWRTKKVEEFAARKISALNRDLRQMLLEEGVDAARLDSVSKTGALPDTICGALSHYKIRALTTKAKWRDVIRGKSSLPTFRSDMSIPVRCDKPGNRRLARMASGDVELELMITVKPYPRIVLATKKIDEGTRSLLDALLANEDQSTNGYRQRCFEVKEDQRTRQWWLYVTYDLPDAGRPKLSPERVVGVDLGFSCPVYAALSNGHARLGRRHFAALAARIRALQTQVFARRRSMLSGGRSGLSDDTARSGHGRRRKLRATEKLEGRVNRAYTALNHQLSSAVIAFALDHGAGTIQIEDLEGLHEHLSGTFLGARWRYHQLQEFIKYKAKENGIAVNEVDPTYTSRRCSNCGHIHKEFTRRFRDASAKDGWVTRFECPQCEWKSDPDYNAARNLALLDIAGVIRRQCAQQEVRSDEPVDAASDILEAAE